jgi:hypothetical protein
MKRFGILIGIFLIDASTVGPSNDEQEFEPPVAADAGTGEEEDVVRVFVSAEEYKHLDAGTERPASKGKRIEKYQEGQGRFDEIFGDLYFPLLTENHEDLVRDGGRSSSTVELGSLLGRSKTAVVYRVRGDRNKVLKYQVDWDNDEETGKRLDVHPLLRDAWCLMELKDSPIVPKVYYISPPSIFVKDVYRKTDFLLSRRERLETFLTRDRSVRFLLMQRVDKDLYQLVNKGRLHVEYAVLFLKKIIQGIVYIHSRGVVHGDIHPGNIGLIEDPSARIVFFDFGSGFFEEELEGKPEKIRPSMTFNHCLFSHWNLEGFRFGKRDDVFKALMVGAFLMNGSGWTEYCQSLKSDPERMLLFKKEAFLFEFPGGEPLSGLLAGKPVEMIEQVRGRLENILRIAREPGTVQTVPNYDGIIAELDAVLALF